MHKTQSRPARIFVQYSLLIFEKFYDIIIYVEREKKSKQFSKRLQKKVVDISKIIWYNKYIKREQKSRQQKILKKIKKCLTFKALYDIINT